MSLDPETREIAGHTYTFRPLGAKAGMRLFTQLVQRLGGSLGPALVGGVADKSAIGAAALSTLATQLDPDFVERMAATFAERTVVRMDAEHGSKDVALDKVLDLHFGGRVLAQLQWLQFCLETQYADFLGLWNDRLGALVEGARKGG